MFYSHLILSYDMLYKLSCYLQLDPIICFEVVNQLFKCVGSYFLFGALITINFSENTSITTARLT